MFASFTFKRVLAGLAVIAIVLISGCKPKGNVMTDNKFNFDPETNQAVQVDPAVTKELYSRWRSPRLGKANPERMNNPVWEWLVKTRINAFQANEVLSGPSPFQSGPGWCFDRMGQSSNSLPDGRVIFIAGEHEDSYDPDFYIYNDVVIQHPDGRIDLFGYPREIFPPTDFHSATVMGDQIIIIGNLGYPNDRHPDKTQVLSLNLKSFEISTVNTSGEMPGWIHGHTVTLSEDGHSILIQRGKLDRGSKDASLVENIDDWRLHLNGWRWERLTERRWPRWEVRRKDDEPNHMFDYQRAVWAKEMPGLDAEVNGYYEKIAKVKIPTLQEELGKVPDLNLFTNRYRPSVAHTPMQPKEDEFGVHRIKVGDTTVRFVEQMNAVQMTVEGELPAETLEELTGDLLKKISALENAPCELIKL